MIGIILGVLFILGGIVAGGMAFLAAGMASRSVTNWESLYLPLILFAVPVVIGALLILFRSS